VARGVTAFELGTTVTAFTLPVATTTNVPVVVTVVVPSFAWTVKGYVPAGVVPLVVVMVSVEVLLVKVAGPRQRGRILSPSRQTMGPRQ